MDDPQTTVLLVEADPVDARQIQDALAGTGDNSTGENTFHVEWVIAARRCTRTPGQGGYRDDPA